MTVGIELWSESSACCLAVINVKDEHRRRGKMSIKLAIESMID